MVANLAGDSIDSLIRRALRCRSKSKIYLALLSELHQRATEEVFSKAACLAKSSDSRKRLLGVQILGLLGLPDKTFVGRGAELLVRLLPVEKDPLVLSAIGWGLNHLGADYDLALLIRHKDSEHSAVRLGVVGGLLGKVDPRAIDTLIELSHDDDVEVRDWSTFGLGAQISVDSPVIRDALFERLFDSDCDTRIEAIHGLAARCDLRVIEQLKERLVPQEVTVFDLEAAKTLASSELVPALLRLRAAGIEDEEALEQAVEACMQATI